MGWCGEGPYLAITEPDGTLDYFSEQQSFWEPFELPTVPDWPDLRKWSCSDIAKAENQST